MCQNLRAMVKPMNLQCAKIYEPWLVNFRHKTLPWASICIHVDYIDIHDIQSHLIAVNTFVFIVLIAQWLECRNDIPVTWFDTRSVHLFIGWIGFWSLWPKKTSAPTTSQLWVRRSAAEPRTWWYVTGSCCVSLRAVSCSSKETINVVLRWFSIVDVIDPHIRVLR